jgi:nicotinamidase-related amidase
MEPPILESLKERIAPAHTALFIIDMQKDFCVDGFATSKAGRPLEAAQSIVPQVVNLRAKASRAGVLVCHIGFWTLPDHMSDSGPWLTQRRRSTYASDKIAIEGSEGAEFIDDLKPADGELEIFKHRYSAFKGTNLDMLLRAHEIRTVVVTGVSTNVCVESAVRDAFEYSYYVCVPEDAVASWDMSLHAATLRTIDARFGVVSSCAEIAKIWDAASAQGRAAE